MPDFVSLADVPEIALADSGGPVKTRIPVARIGKYKDRRYGEFAITAEMAASWQRNLAEHFNGEVPIDYDHGPETGKSSEAAAWIKGLAVEGEYVMGDVEFTPQGAQAVRDGRWRYISPTFKDNAVDEQQRPIGAALIGAGLTNRPFLKRGMPAISLSADEFAEPAAAVADPSDSRPHMPELTKIAQALKLSDDADETKVLDAISGLIAGSEGSKTLAELAAAEGKVVLDAETFTTLQAGAAAGADAAKTLSEQRFENAWQAALTDPKGARVVPAVKESFKALYDAQPDQTIKLLEQQPVIAPGQAKGTGDGPAVTEAPEGVDQDRYELHEAATARAAKDGIPYEQAVTLCAAEMEA